jgi:hypothetical protein
VRTESHYLTMVISSYILQFSEGHSLGISRNRE